jgi:hypothetical protein
MNSPFVIQQAQNLVKRTEIAMATSEAEKIQALYRLAWQRPADKSEVRMGQQFLAQRTADQSSLSPLEEYAQVLLLSNELVFVD